jgi:hypothetical protein
MPFCRKKSQAFSAAAVASNISFVYMLMYCVHKHHINGFLNALSHPVFVLSIIKTCKYICTKTTILLKKNKKFS